MPPAVCPVTVLSAWASAIPANFCPAPLKGMAYPLESIATRAPSWIFTLSATRRSRKSPVKRRRITSAERAIAQASIFWFMVTGLSSAVRAPPLSRGAGGGGGADLSAALRREAGEVGELASVELRLESARGGELRLGGRLIDPAAA